MEPDLSRVTDLAHWGGRLWTHGAVGLLLGNAVILGGIVALLLRSGKRLVQRLHEEPAVERISVIPAPAPTSVPPPPSEYSGSM
jgi:hypothetical protein